MPTRVYKSDKEQLLAEGKMIVNSTDDSKFQHKVEMVNLVLGGMNPSELCEYVSESKNTITSWVKIVDEKGKESVLEYEVIAKKDNLALVDINLITGRSHQIRVQFSSRGNPLYGDLKYNKNALIGEQIALFAYQLEIIHPITKEKMTFKLPKPDRYPFNMF